MNNYSIVEVPKRNISSARTLRWVLMEYIEDFRATAAILERPFRLHGKIENSNKDFTREEARKVFPDFALRVDHLDYTSDGFIVMYIDGRLKCGTLIFPSIKNKSCHSF